MAGEAEVWCVFLWVGCDADMEDLLGDLDLFLRGFYGGGWEVMRVDWQG